MQDFFSAPQHTMRSPHYCLAPKLARIAISSRAIHLRGRQLNRYRRLENDIKKVCGKPSARKHGGRSYNIGANNGSKRGHAQGASAASTHAGKQGRPHRDGGLKSPPLTRYRQARTATRPRGRTDSKRSEQAREQAGTLYMGATRHMRTIYSVK